jgi:iron complex outermembrane recepter protein
MKSLRSRLAILLLASTMLAPLDALAQAVQASSDEIVITARKREEAAKDVPLSVSVYSPQKLDEVSAGGADITFLGARTPSVNVESSFGRTFPRFYIRGLGNVDFDLNASQPVSLVFDDVVQENPVLKGFPVFDLQRIEVLRGPQGTLFGRNTPAGVVKFESVAAGAGAPGYAKMEMRNLGGIAGEGAVGFDIAPGLALRVAGQINTQDDWVDNRGPGGRTQLGGYTDQAIRAQLRYQPTSDLDMSLSINARDYDGTGQLFRANAIRPGQGGLVGGFDREGVFYDGGAGNPQKLRTIGGVGKIEWDVGAGLTLTSVTGYQTIDNFFSRGDIDGGLAVGPPASAVTPFSSETSDEVTDHSQFSQEFRLASGPGGAFDWLIGAYFFDEELSVLSLSYNTLAAGAVNGRSTLRQETEAWAIFGSASFKPTEALTLTAGLRYSDEEKTYRGARTLSPFGAPNITRTQKVGDEAVSWDLSAVYAVDADQNLYARVARGFRAPAIQGRILFSDAVTTAKSEFVTSYEVGYKASLWDGRVRADASIFYYEIDDQQFTAIGGAGNFNQLLNANKGVGQGAELDVLYTPTENWAFNLGVAYNDTEIQDRNREVAICSGVPTCTVLDPIRVVPGVPFPTTLANINGNPFVNAPEWTANIGARWQTELADGASVFVSTDWAYKGETNFTLYESREFREEGFWEGGLRAGWTSPGERFSLVVFGRNITDEERLVGGVDFNNLAGFLNQPRIYGAELKVTY